MLTLTRSTNQLAFAFPEVHADAVCTMTFERTLRIPDDNKTYALPPSLGSFPLLHVDDYPDKVPAVWREHGGVFMPMYQSEAMWIRFHSRYPFAVKIAAGKINAVDGEPWHTTLTKRSGPRQGTDAGPEQDYLVLPEQPWLDGFSIGGGKIRQFVAMPLGDGYTVEEQVTKEAVHGGLQILVYPLKADRYTPVYARAWKDQSDIAMPAAPSAGSGPKTRTFFQSAVPSAPVVQDMGLAPGGVMRQKIYPDSFGLDAWDTSRSEKCFVHLVNAEVFQHITGNAPPQRKLTAADYHGAKLPWFKLYDETLGTLTGAATLKHLDSVAALAVKKGETPLIGEATGPQGNVVPLNRPQSVRTGDF
jgi:hypothetical protein